MRKGESLPINYIIILVLALIVLAVGIGFLFGVGGGPMSQAELIKQQQLLCGSYLRSDPTCKYDGVEVDSDTKTKLGSVCQKLGGYSSCTGSLSKDCLKQCCSTYCG